MPHADSIVGDVKLSNLVLDIYGNGRVLDFGGSACDNRTTPSFDDPVVPRDHIRALTLKYRAPELDSDSGVASVSSKVDVYSFGKMLHKLRKVGVWKNSEGARARVFSFVTLDLPRSETDISTLQPGTSCSRLSKQ
jgi:serine/threonine protein kinase